MENVALRAYLPITPASFSSVGRKGSRGRFEEFTDASHKPPPATT
jgi:hypothetical protein